MAKLVSRPFLGPTLAVLGDSFVAPTNVHDWLTKRFFILRVINPPSSISTALGHLTPSAKRQSLLELQLLCASNCRRFFYGLAGCRQMYVIGICIHNSFSGPFCWRSIGARKRPWQCAFPTDRLAQSNDGVAVRSSVPSY